MAPNGIAKDAREREREGKFHYVIPIFLAV
jgi:hypothetical protein